MVTIAEALEEAAAGRILIKDGAFGTLIQSLRLDSDGYRGDLELSRDQRGNNDLLNLTRPQIVQAMINDFACAGADILATNSFNANRISQADYGAEHLVREINLTAAHNVRAITEQHEARDGRKRFIAGAIGPTNKTLSLSPKVSDPGYRDVDFDTMSAVYAEQVEALVEGGVDLILVETVFDTLNAKAAIHAVRSVEQRLGREIPLMLSMTITDLSGRNLSGHGVEAFWASIRHARPVAVGLNCSFGAAQLRAHVAALAAVADTLIIAYPNAGLPNDMGEYDEGPETTAVQVAEWAQQGIVNIVGGCCGTTPAHIAAIARSLRDFAPRPVRPQAPHLQLAGMDPMIAFA